MIHNNRENINEIEFLDSVQCNMEGIWAETYAVSTYNMRLFSNICRYKGEKVR